MIARIGRKTIFLLTIVGMVLMDLWLIAVVWFTLPIRLIWLGTVFQIIGGGNTVLGSMLYAMISDVASDDDRWVQSRNLHRSWANID